MSFWWTSRGPYTTFSVTVAYGSQTLATFSSFSTQPPWTLATYTFTTTAANQNIVFTATAPAGTDQSFDVAYFQFIPATYVGINTASPAYALDVSGTINGSSNINAQGGNIAIIGTNTQLDIWNYCSVAQNSSNMTVQGRYNLTLQSYQCNVILTTSNQNWIFSNNSNSTNVLTISGGGNLSNSNATSNNIGGSTLSNSILTVGAATAGSTTSGSVNVSGGYFVNGVALATGGGSTISGTTTSGTVLLATGTSTGLQGSSNLFFSNSSNLGIQTTTPATALDVNGGVTIRNGYRPSYSNVSSGTSLTVPSAAYGTHFNITASSITGITLPTVVGSTDSNAYWVFRNNTAGYLSITFTYTTAGTTYPTNPVTIPPANSLTMMVTFPSSVLGYVLF